MACTSSAQHPKLNTKTTSLGLVKTSGEGFTLNIFQIFLVFSVSSWCCPFPQQIPAQLCLLPTHPPFQDSERLNEIPVCPPFPRLIKHSSLQLSSYSTCSKSDTTSVAFFWPFCLLLCWWDPMLHTVLWMQSHWSQMKGNNRFSQPALDALELRSSQPPPRAPASASTLGRNLLLWSQPGACPDPNLQPAAPSRPEGAAGQWSLACCRWEGRGPHWPHGPKACDSALPLPPSTLSLLCFLLVILIPAPFVFPLSTFPSSPSHPSPLGKQLDAVAPSTSRLAFKATCF